tara:strand:+ start:4322 stop:5131 length:810 start_codon:yes stop_codon:yes gene_type:complete
MSRSFLKRVNRMTEQGQYPSLKILLEKDEDEKFDMPDDDADKKEEAKDDDIFGDDSGDEDAMSGSDDDESSEEEAPKPEEASEDEDIVASAELGHLKNQLSIVAGNDKSIEVEKATKSFFPNAIYTVSENYNLKNFLLLSEDKDLDNDIESAVQVIKDREDDIKTIDAYVKGIETKGKSKPIDIDRLIDKAIDIGDNWESHLCIYSVVASGFLKHIYDNSKVNEELKSMEDFAYKLASKLNKQGKSHTINVDAITNNNYATASGARDKG